MLQAAGLSNRVKDLQKRVTREIRGDMDAKAKIVILKILFINICRTHSTSPTFIVEGLQGDTDATST